MSVIWYTKAHRIGSATQIYGLIVASSGRTSAFRDKQFLGKSASLVEAIQELQIGGIEDWIQRPLWGLLR